MFKRLKKNQKGFTLVELIVVIAILGVLSLLIVPRVLENVETATNNREIANARVLASEITVWNAKQPTAATKIVSSGGGGVVIQSDFEKAAVVGPPAFPANVMPSNVTWPDPLIVEVLVDDSGNGAIDIK